MCRRQIGTSLYHFRSLLDVAVISSLLLNTLEPALHLETSLYRVRASSVTLATLALSVYTRWVEPLFQHHTSSLRLDLRDHGISTPLCGRWIPICGGIQMG
jgi:hypothetical protein